MSTHYRVMNPFSIWHKILDQEIMIYESNKGQTLMSVTTLIIRVLYRKVIHGPVDTLFTGLHIDNPDPRLLPVKLRKVDLERVQHNSNKDT